MAMMDTPQRKKARRSAVYEEIDQCVICAMTFKGPIESSDPFQANASLRLAVLPTCGHPMCAECYEIIKKKKNECALCKDPITEVYDLGEHFYLRGNVAEMDSIHEQQVVKVKKVVKNNENLRKNPWKKFGDVDVGVSVRKELDYKYVEDKFLLTALNLHHYWGITCNVAVGYEQLKGSLKPFGVHLYPQNVFIKTDHTMTITGIKQHETNPYLILTSSMDGTVAVLDNRLDDNVMLTERIPSEQFVRPLWDLNNEHLFLAGSTTGTLVTFDQRYCSGPIISIDNMHLQMAEKSSIVGLYNYQDSKESLKFTGFNSSPEIVAVTQTGIDLLFKDNEKVYTRQNVFTEKMNYVSNSAFHNGSKTILAITQFSKIPGSLQNGNSEAYRYQFMQLPAWNYTLAKSVPLHQWYVRNIFNFSREKLTPPVGEKQYALKEYTGLNKVTMLDHPDSEENPTVLIATCHPGLPLTVDCYREGAICPLRVEQLSLYEHFRANRSVTSCAFRDGESCIMLLRKNDWSLFSVIKLIEPDSSDPTISSTSDFAMSSTSDPAMSSTSTE
jgi:hypothetical protein